MLDPAPGRINLIVAPNGAGKSVLRQALGDLLFGIPVRSDMDFRYSAKAMRLFANVIGDDGAPFEFGRRKGQGVTLIDAAGQALPAGFLDPVLHGAQRSLLDQLFALDTERLRRGGAELLETGGSLADALLSAAGGLRQASALREQLAAARDALAPTRKARERPFYKALDALLEARRQKKACSAQARTASATRACLAGGESRACSAGHGVSRACRQTLARGAHPPDKPYPCRTGCRERLARSQSRRPRPCRPIFRNGLLPHGRRCAVPRTRWRIAPAGAREPKRRLRGLHRTLRSLQMGPRSRRWQGTLVRRSRPGKTCQVAKANCARQKPVWKHTCATLASRKHRSHWNAPRHCARRNRRSDRHAV